MGDAGILLASSNDVLDPIFLNITIYPLELVDTHALHPTDDTLVVLLMLLLYPPFSLPSTSTLALILFLLLGKMDGALGILLLPFLAVIARIRVLLFLV